MLALRNPSWRRLVVSYVPRGLGGRAPEEGKWKHKELGRRIKWTGPTLPLPPSDCPDQERWKKAPDRSLQSPLQELLGLAPTKVEEEERQRALNDADNKYFDERLRKLPLLAQHYGFDAPKDSWIGIAERNDLWLLNLALVLAQELVPGFMLDVGERQGARTWDQVAQARLIADIEAVKLDGKKACGDNEACVRLVTRSEKRPEYKELYGKNPNNQSAHKRARFLELSPFGGKKESLIGRLLANAENETKQQLIDGSFHYSGLFQLIEKLRRPGWIPQG